MRKKKFSAVIAAAIMMSLAMVSATSVLADGIASGDAEQVEEAVHEHPGVIENAAPGSSIHKKIDISKITGEIAEPPQLTSAASSVARQKEWYEYIYYSEEPVGYCYYADNIRIAFYDPYEYGSALVMEVDDSLTDWSSNNSLQISYTTGDSISATEGKSQETKTEVIPGYTDEETTIQGANTVKTSVTQKTETYNTILGDTTTTHNSSTDWGLATTVGAELSTTGKLFGVEMEGKVMDSLTTNTNWSEGTSFTSSLVVGDKNGEDGGTRTGYTISDDKTTVETGSQSTTVTNKIADRVVNATGYTTNNTISLVSHNSTTITKTYDASHFNANGSPLQWKILKYTVKMPMRYQVEYLIDDEWIHSDYSYCLLNTVQGTTRAWMQNSVVYYEHWGSGEAVTWDEFWGQFFTPDSLIAAYQNKLYPDMN